MIIYKVVVDVGYTGVNHKGIFKYSLFQWQFKNCKSISLGKTWAHNVHDCSFFQWFKQEGPTKKSCFKVSRKLETQLRKAGVSAIPGEDVFQQKWFNSLEVTVGQGKVKIDVSQSRLNTLPSPEKYPLEISFWMLS